MEVQVLKAGKGGSPVLALSGDEDKLQAAAQLVIGAAAIYDGSATAITASQVRAGTHTIVVKKWLQVGRALLVTTAVLEVQRRVHNPRPLELLLQIGPQFMTVFTLSIVYPRAFLCTCCN